MERFSNSSIFSSNSSIISSLLSFSSALIRNVKNIDFNFSNDLQAIVAASKTLAIGNDASGTTTTASPQPTLLSSKSPSPLPGPWAFATSYYAFGAIVTAFILNRIQHIVAPRPRQARVRSASNVWYNFRDRFLPLDSTSTVSRLTLNLPALYLLLRAILLLVVTLLQVSELYPRASWAESLNIWAAGKEMSHLCWNAYIAVCTGLCCSALTRGLMDDGDDGNAMPFNLAAYGFLLHIYASPIAHTIKEVGPGLHSRPGRDIIITITLPVLQITMLQFLLIRKQWANKRLVPTAVCGLMSLAHFYTVIWWSPLTYPPLNFVPCVLTSTLIFVSLVTCTLNAVTQLLAEGEISRPLFGHNQALPRWEDDFEIALLRLGTAALQATQIAGLSNQVASINTGTVLFGELELSLSGVSSMAPPVGVRRGFFREYKVSAARRAHAGDLFTGPLWRELKRFGTSSLLVLGGLWRHCMMKTKKAVTSPSATPLPSVTARHVEMNDEDLYALFLRGYPMPEDSDEEYRPVPDDDVSVASLSDDSDPDEGGTDTINLYSDLFTPHAEFVNGTPDPQVLLAHLSSSNSGTLTRRRYSRLMQQDPALDADWGVFLDQRRQAVARQPVPDAWDAERRRNCVICTVEPRSIVCWPCRCLAMCDDCRTNLASRFSASQHMCPCCRRTVDGFSRIYIP